jgi:hypothetical protein
VAQWQRQKVLVKEISMQEEYTPEKIIEIINSAANASFEAWLASKEALAALLIISIIFSGVYSSCIENSFTISFYLAIKNRKRKKIIFGFP